mmetsp:Transcript_22633/g.52797  ORF Transcript_22633/g.52797 Transcript_22633/m.52797 type:complete len:165 (+) Transcript_22633:85-579(+)
MGCANSSSGAATAPANVYQLNKAPPAVRIGSALRVDAELATHPAAVLYPSQDSRRTVSTGSGLSGYSSSKPAKVEYDSMKPSPVGMPNNSKAPCAPDYRTQELYIAELTKTLQYVEKHPQVLERAVGKLRRDMEVANQRAAQASAHTKEESEHDGGCYRNLMSL